MFKTKQNKEKNRFFENFTLSWPLKCTRVQYRQYFSFRFPLFYSVSHFEIYTSSARFGERIIISNDFIVTRDFCAGVSLLDVKLEWGTVSRSRSSLRYTETVSGYITIALTVATVAGLKFAEFIDTNSWTLETGVF